MQEKNTTPPNNLQFEGLWPDQFCEHTVDAPGKVAQFCQAFKVFVERQNTFNQKLDVAKEASPYSTFFKSSSDSESKKLQSAARLAQEASQNDGVPTFLRHSIIQRLKFTMLVPKLTFCRYHGFNIRGILEGLATKKEIEKTTGRASLPVDDYTRLPDFEQKTCGTTLSLMKQLADAEALLDKQARSSMAPTAKQSEFKAGESIEPFCDRIKVHDSSGTSFSITTNSLSLRMTCLALYNAQAPLPVLVEETGNTVQINGETKPQFKQIDPKDYDEETKRWYMNHVLQRYAYFATAAKIMSEAPDVPESVAEKYLDAWKTNTNQRLRKLEDDMTSGVYGVLDSLGGPLIGDALNLKWPDLTKAELPDINPNKPLGHLDPAVIQRVNYAGQLMYYGLFAFKETLEAAEATLEERRYKIDSPQQQGGKHA